MSALPETKRPTAHAAPTAPPVEDDRHLALVADQVAEEGEQLALFDADEHLGPLRHVPCHKAHDADHDRARCWLCPGNRHL